MPWLASERMDWRDREGVRWLEASLPGATAAFSTRIGGVSDGNYAELNLGMLTADSFSSVRENRRRLTQTLDRDPDGVLMGYQVHEVKLVQRDQPPEPNPWLGHTSPPDQADGQATANPELTPLVQVADCLPVALVGSGGVAMLHCGWRGLAAGMIARGVEAVGATAAAVGPGIGPCCFEVGPEVAERFAELGDGIADGRMLDLPEVALRLLIAAGLVPDAIELSGHCTSCEPETFYSYRRDGERSGRQAGLVWSDA